MHSAVMGKVNNSRKDTPDLLTSSARIYLMNVPAYRITSYLSIKNQLSVLCLEIALGLDYEHFLVGFTQLLKVNSNRVNQV